MRRLTVTLVAIVIASAAATHAHAAPWSLNLPEGYVEQPGAADAQVEQLRKVPGTVSLDAQVYMSPDGSVQLTRMTWTLRLVEPTRAVLLEVERGMVAGSAQEGTKHVSDRSYFAGNHLLAEQIDELDDLRMIQRRFYAVDTANVMTMFTVMCAGPADQLAECEKAQQSMQLMLPNQATLRDAAEKPERNTAYKIGQLMGALILAGLVFLWYRSGAHIWRRPKKS